MAPQPRYDDLTPETIADALSFIDPNIARADWARIGMAIKSELGDAVGFGLFDDWSKAGRSYNAVDCADTWKSINTAGGVNIGTLIYQAKQNGFSLTDDRARLDEAEIERRREERAAERKAAEADRKRKRGEAAKLANQIWDEAKPAGDDFAYLAEKRVKAHGLAVGKWPLFDKETGEPYRYIHGALLIPIMDAKGKIISLQGVTVGHDGDTTKRYLKGGQKTGGYHMIGTPPEAGGILAFCEGYATGATIHELTGWPVIVCFDAANLPTVAEMLREPFGQAAFIICADNDKGVRAGNIENPGVHYAKLAATKTRGALLVPEFADGSTGTDFNDLAAELNDAACRDQLLNNPITRGGEVVTITLPGGIVANDNAIQYDGLPDVSMKLKPLSTIANLQIILERINATCRYNIMTKDVEFFIPGHDYVSDVAAAGSLGRLISICGKFEYPTANVDIFLTDIAGKNPYNPIMTWIESKPWDGVPRMASLIDTIKTKADVAISASNGASLKEMLMRRWLLSAVQAMASPVGVAAQGILVLQGPQGLGKTRWFSGLVPEALNAFQDGVILNPSDKDSVKQAVSKWIVELGELDATFRKADLAQLKAFVTRRTDTLRLPYARKEHHFARRTVFGGSVNPDEFLHDLTGNRRYWTVACVDIDLAAQARIDMQQMWAEVYARLQAGEQWFLTADEERALNGHNETFQAIDTVEERLLGGLDWQADRSLWTWKMSTEILLSIGVDRPTQGDAMKCSTTIKRLNGGQHRRAGGKGLLLCPPKTRSREIPDDAPF